MADDQEKTEVCYFNEKGTNPFFYVSHFGTKVKSFQDFMSVLLRKLNG